jgi:O-antigen/teichoic acid export membrane protein
MSDLAVRNGMWNGLSHVIGAGTGIVGSILVVNSLTPEAYGEFGYYLWLFGIVGTLGTLSLPNAITKITSELRGAGRSHEAISLTFWVLLTVTVLNALLAACLILGSFRGGSEEAWFLVAIAVALIPNGAAAVCRSFLWGKQRYRDVSAVVSGTSIAQLGFIVIAWQNEWSTLGFVIATVLGTVAQSIVLFLLLIRRYQSRLKIPARPQSTLWRHYVGFAGPFALALIIEVIIWQRSEIFFLERYGQLDQAGYYNLAYTFYGMLLTLGWAAVTGFYPAISHDFGSADWERIAYRFRQGALIAMVFAAPIALGGWVTAGPLITLFYGAKMQPAILVTRVLFLGLLPGTLAAMMGLTLSAVGGIWVHVKLGVLLSAVNIALDLTLIPRWGAVGGAIANLAVQAAYSILLIVVLRKSYRLELPWRLFAKVGAIAVMTTLFLPWLLSVYSLGLGGLTVVIVLAAVFYLALLCWVVESVRQLVRTRIVGKGTGL